MDMKAEIVKLLYKEGITMETFPSLFETVFNVCMKVAECSKSMSSSPTDQSKQQS
jgi:hypothetical protein